MAELTVPQVDFSILGNLGKTYNDSRQEAVRQRALSQLGQGGTLDPSVLLSSGDMSLANLGVQIKNQQTQGERDSRDFAFRQEESKRAQGNADRSFGLQSRAAARADEGPEAKAAQRARVAGQYGIQQGTPEFRSFVLTGDLPSQNTTVAAQTEQRKAAALANGLTPDTPAYQSYVLTGKMPREDAQPLTATDKKAILEADEGVMTATSAIDALKRAKELSPKAMGFKGAGSIASVGSVLGNQASRDTVELDNIVSSNALSQLKAIFGGNPTEGERKIMLDIQGSSGLPDAVRQKIYDRGIAMAERRLDFNKRRVDEMRGGQFYKPQGSMSRAPVQQTQGISQQQYEALPSGSPFTAPDGTQRIKP